MKFWATITFVMSIVVLAVGTSGYPWWVTMTTCVLFLLARSVGGEYMLLIAGWFFVPWWLMLAYSTVLIIPPFFYGYISSKFLDDNTMPSGKEDAP